MENIKFVVGTRLIERHLDGDTMKLLIHRLYSEEQFKENDSILEVIYPYGHQTPLWKVLNGEE